MSYEYFSEMSTENSYQLFLKLVEKIREFDNLETSHSSNSLILKNKTSDDSWDRDIEIFLQPNGIFVIFYSGNKNFIVEMLAFVESLAKNLGFDCVFEEE